MKPPVPSALEPPVHPCAPSRPWRSFAGFALVVVGACSPVVEPPLPSAVTTTTTVAPPAPSMPVTTVLETTTVIVGSAPPTTAPPTTAPPTTAPPTAAPPTAAPPPDEGDGLEWAGLRSFPDGVESDCAASVDDADGHVWLIDMGEPGCGWKIDIASGGKTCTTKTKDVFTFAAGDVVVTMETTGPAVDRGDKWNSNTFRPAVLAVRHAGRTLERPVTIRAFCRR